ncbi:hypothetical protein [uncultured Acinetobacter sp.]|uniref:hypothetical protein n=1 Tax=uncultured Acinetobacter sp. TaxID=165433 RepID=UPI0037478A20
MKLDRQLQQKILKISSEFYPSAAYEDLEEIYSELDDHVLAANLKYLEQHGLIEEGSVHVSLDGFFSFGSVTMTHYGMDFLADDGGLSAILGVVTIKFEAETLKALLENKINQSDLAPADKHKLIDGLRSLSAESTKHLITKVVDVGWDNLGTLIRIIQSSLF